MNTTIQGGIVQPRLYQVPGDIIEAQQAMEPLSIAKGPGPIMGYHMDRSSTKFTLQGEASSSINGDGAKRLFGLGDIHQAHITAHGYLSIDPSTISFPNIVMRPGVKEFRLIAVKASYTPPSATPNPDDGLKPIFTAVELVGSDSIHIANFAKYDYNNLIGTLARIGFEINRDHEVLIGLYQKGYPNAYAGLRSKNQDEEEPQGREGERPPQDWAYHFYDTIGEFQELIPYGYKFPICGHYTIMDSVAMAIEKNRQWPLGESDIAHGAIGSQHIGRGVIESHHLGQGIVRPQHISPQCVGFDKRNNSVLTGTLDPSSTPCTLFSYLLLCNNCELGASTMSTMIYRYRLIQNEPGDAPVPYLDSEKTTPIVGPSGASYTPTQVCHPKSNFDPILVGASGVQLLGSKAFRATGAGNTMKVQHIQSTFPMYTALDIYTTIALPLEEVQLLSGIQAISVRNQYRFGPSSNWEPLYSGSYLWSKVISNNGLLNLKFTIPGKIGSAKGGIQLMSEITFMT